MGLYIVDIHGDIEGDYEIVRKYEEPKTGHWIFVGEENEEETRNDNFRYICSECGYSDIHAKSTYVPYCWHCGVKMAKQEET
jgi:predicted RNA-binding Zn-ribbon protein involved in translation (DUF1610 family)